MRLRLGKKASIESILDVIILQLLPFGIILIGTVALISAEMEDTTTARAYLSRDISMNLYPVFSSPGNLYNYYTFPSRFYFTEQGIHYFNISFKDNLVDVMGRNFPYAYDSNMFFQPSDIKKTDNLVFLNHGTTAEIMTLSSKKLSGSYHLYKKQPVPLTDVSAYNWNSREIVLIPDNTQLSKNIISSLKSENLNIKELTTPATEIYLELIIDNSSDIIAQIQYNKAAKSRKLATILVNNLIDNIQNSSSLENAYIRVADTEYNAESVVILTVGEKLAPKILSFRNTIKDSIRGYFEKWH